MSDVCEAQSKMRLRILQFLGSGVVIKGVSVGIVAARMGIKRHAAENVLLANCVYWHPSDGYQITELGIKAAGIERAPYYGSCVAGG